jgi:hypothetical protein
MVAGDAGVYEAKYGWNRQPARVIGISLAFCLVMLVVPAPLWARIFVVGFFGIGAVIITAASLTRRTALRIDPSGVSVRRCVLQPRSAAFYPWEDVEKILNLGREQQIDHERCSDDPQ